MASAEISMDIEEDVPVSVPIRQRCTSDMRASSLPIKPEEYTVGYVYSLEMMIHYSRHGHPEQPERISRIHDALGEAKCLSKMKRLPIRPVRREESLLVHSEDHWDKVRDIQSESCGTPSKLDGSKMPWHLFNHQLHAYLETCSTTS
jgi:histone deacetylase 6